MDNFSALLLDGEESKQEAQPEQPSEAGEKTSSGPDEGGGREERTQGPLPEVTLSTFIFSLSSSALVHLGAIPEPETSVMKVDLPIAKQIIDTLGMLQEKTKGNLDEGEDKLLRSILYDLRMRYVEKTSK